MKKILYIVILIITLVMLASCGKIDDSEGNDDKVERKLITITDNSGEKQITTNPSKIVVMDLGILDIIDQIGLDTLGIKKLGLPKANLTSALNKYNDDKYVDMGTFFEIDETKFLAFETEMVFVANRQTTSSSTVSALSPLFKNLEVIDMTMDWNANGLRDTLRNIELMAKIFPQKATEILALKNNLVQKVNELQAKVQAQNYRTTVLMVNNQSMTVFGPKERFNIIFHEFGFINADNNLESSTKLGDQHGQGINYEYFTNTNPELIFVIDRGDAVEGSGTASALLDNSFVKNTTAGKNGKIIYLNSGVWYLSYGGYNATLSMINNIINNI